MSSLLQRQIASIEQRLILIAPPSRPIPSAFLNVQPDLERRRAYLHELQRLRGGIYFGDGAVRCLSEDGRHETPEDERSWHLLTLDAEQRVSACIRYLEHDAPVSVDELKLSSGPLVVNDEWHDRVRGAVTSELVHAESRRVPYGQVGGWATRATRRGSSEGVLLALSCFSLARVFGGALCIAAATVRHGSATILRRLGGSLLECQGVEVPSYFDPHYECEMELLRFDSRREVPKYEYLLDGLTSILTEAVVLTSDAAAMGFESEASVAA